MSVTTMDASKTMNSGFHNQKARAILDSSNATQVTKFDSKDFDSNQRSVQKDTDVQILDNLRTHGDDIDQVPDDPHKQIHSRLHTADPTSLPRTKKILFSMQNDKSQISGIASQNYTAKCKQQRHTMMDFSKTGKTTLEQKNMSVPHSRQAYGNLGSSLNPRYYGDQNHGKPALAFQKPMTANSFMNSMDCNSSRGVGSKTLLGDRLKKQQNPYQTQQRSFQDNLVQRKQRQTTYGPRNSKKKFFLNNMEANLQVKNQRSFEKLMQSHNRALSLQQHSTEQSPKIQYSRNVRLSSNEKLFEPETIITAYQKNKMYHKDFNSALVSKEWRRNFKEVIDSKVPKDDPGYCDVSKHFNEQKKLVIKKGINREPLVKKPKLPKEYAKKILTTKSLFQKFERMMNNNYDQQMGQDKQEQSRKTHDYMIEHFFRQMTTQANKNKVLFPNYLHNFQPDLQQTAETHLQYLKSGRYDILDEDRLLNTLLKSIGVDNQKSDKLIKKIGLTSIEMQEDRKFQKLMKAIQSLRSEQAIVDQDMGSRSKSRESAKSRKSSKSKKSSKNERKKLNKSEHLSSQLQGSVNSSQERPGPKRQVSFNAQCYSQVNLKNLNDSAMKTQGPNNTFDAADQNSIQQIQRVDIREVNSVELDPQDITSVLDQELNVPLQARTASNESGERSVESPCTFHTVQQEQKENPKQPPFKKRSTILFASIGGKRPSKKVTEDNLIEMSPEPISKNKRRNNATFIQRKDLEAKPWTASATVTESDVSQIAASQEFKPVLKQAKTVKSQTRRQIQKKITLANNKIAGRQHTQPNRTPYKDRKPEHKSELPFAYEEYNMSPVTRKEQYNKLYSHNYTTSIKSIPAFHRNFDSQLIKMQSKIKQYTETVDFVQEALETGFVIEYDNKIGLDKNLSVYQTQKKQQDDADQENFLNKKAVVNTCNDTFKQSYYIMKLQKQGPLSRRGKHIWRHNKVKVPDLNYT